MLKIAEKICIKYIIYGVPSKNKDTKRRKSTTYLL